MKQLLIALLLCTALAGGAQNRIFRFAFISDTHIGSPNGSAEEDLRRTVRDINSMNDVAFVVITGDITELGTPGELRLAKQILDSLRVPWYIIPGNHDTGWSESGGFDFNKTFGSDRFAFEYKGVKFIGCASGPYVRMSDGHVPKDAVTWLENVLKATRNAQPVIFLNHYPMDAQMDNWYEIIGRLKTRNTILALCGHGHANRKMDFEDIPAVMGRSNLRAKAAVGGYNLVDITKDSALFHERQPGVQTLPAWARMALHKGAYAQRSFPRPDYSVNDEYANVRASWVFSSAANVISTPAVAEGKVIFGNQQGHIHALDLATGKPLWSYQAGAAVYSSPAVAQQRVITGSADGNIYCLRLSDGKLLWKFRAGAAVLGSPVIEGNVIYIGASDHRIRAIDLQSGTTVWEYDGLSGPVVGTPLLYGGKLFLGAWDTYLYALDKRTGSLSWKWSNGSPVRNYSPASCTPVAVDGLVYVVAPDRYITAIDTATGMTAWRTNESMVRESQGLSADGKLVYGKTMNDTLVAFSTGRGRQHAVWKLHCGYGYDHVPSMPVEKEGMGYFGTRPGVVYCIDPAQRKVAWKHKLDNSMVNTVQVLGDGQLVVATMDGKVSLLRVW